MPQGTVPTADLAQPPSGPPVGGPSGIPSLVPGGGAPPSGTPDVMAPGVPPRPDPTDPPRPPVTLPRTITKNTELAKAEEPQDIKNPFQRTAAMIVASAGDYAERMSSYLGERASDTQEANADTVHNMMHFSKYGIDAPRVFWQVHDRILEEAVRANDPDPYAAAERGALDEVYPYRAKLALLDHLAPDKRVERADELMRISSEHVAKGNTVESLPFITAPLGLPKPTEQPEPAAPAQQPSSPEPAEGSPY